MQNRYESIIYSEDDSKVLDNTVLTDEEIKLIKNNKIKLNNKNYLCVIEDLFKFHKNNYSTSDIAEIFKVSTRQIQKIFKELGINRDLFEAQQIAVGKRDSEKSAKTYKKIVLERLTDDWLSGSKFDQYLRTQLDLQLGEALPGCEIIIGINSVNIINSENDIPIIIINKNSLYKYIIDVKGNLPVDSDSTKKRGNPKAYYKGYTLFKFNVNASFDTNNASKLKHEKDIQNKLTEIVDIIASEVLENISSLKLEKEI